MYRTLLAIAATSLLAGIIFLGSFAWWLEAQVIDSENFVDSSVTALEEESSRNAMGQLIADQLIDEYPLFIILESNLVGMFADLLAVDALADVVRFVGVEVHERIVTGNQDAIVIDLLDYRDLILGPIEAIAPRLVELVPDEWFLSIEVLEAGALPDLSLYERWIDVLRFGAILGALLLTFLVLWLAKRRGMAVTLVGIAVLLAGLASALLVPGGRWLTLARFEDPSVETIVANTYNQFTGYLMVNAATLILVGVAVLAIGIVLWSAEDA